MKRQTTAILVLVACLTGCWLPGRGGPRGPHPETAIRGLIETWNAAGDTVTFTGFRNPYGKTSPESEVLDELMLSAALRAGVEPSVDVGIAGAATVKDLRWQAQSVLPEGWRDLPGDLVSGGQLRVESPWAYLRLVTADPTSGWIRHDLRTRIAERDLAGLVAVRQRRLAGTVIVGAEPLDVDLHLVVRRNDGGFPQRLDFVEGGDLGQGEQLQLRFRTTADCEIFAFLYRSDGTRESLMSGSVYANRWYYTPSENGWKSLSEADLVYSLYFLAAPRIEEDRTSLWEDLDRFQNEGRIEQFRGLDLVDDAVVRLLQRTVTAADSLTIQRGSEGVELGKIERLVYDDGTTFESRPEQLHGTVIARAYSALVSYR
jgi:hypothetical protein